jgi:Asp-tRNA(Asn)/Glu-tRNA(Gln) amidotransferase A subunit family amidase
VPTTPPLLLDALARMIAHPAGRRVARGVLLDLTRRDAGVPLADWLAGRRADLREPPDGPAILTDPRCAPAPPADGPLAGDHVAVKDSIDVAGLPTGLGLHDGGDLAERDAEIVRRVRAAGGVITGKAPMTELGMDGVGALLPGAMPRNAAAPGHVPGGSSTGTAVAVAAGLARYGVGGDGLGSVRIPAAFNGLVGLKPGEGVLPLEGYRSVAPTMDVPGAIARDAQDCARLFQVLANRPVAPIPARAPARIGVLRGLGPELASRAQRAAFARALAAFGAERRDLEVPGAAAHTALAVACSTAELSQSPYAQRTRSAQGRLALAIGRALAEDADRLRDRRLRLRDAVRRALDGVDVIAMPTTAIPPPAVRRRLVAGGQDALLLRAIGAYTPLANATGLPAIAIPAGRDRRGRPLSIMLMGPQGSEDALLAHAAALEATGLGTQTVEH